MEWQKIFPSAICRVVFLGNKDLARTHYNQGYNFLYALKNAMTLGDIKSLHRNFYLNDGTVIYVGSSYGQDEILIDSPSIVPEIIEVAPELTCTIQLMNVPAFVQPMRYPKEIHSGEIIGTDYIKTYYNFNVANCAGCNNIKWDFLFTYGVPAESRHYYNPVTKKDEPYNHSVYSLDPPCWGEVISHGHDSGGYYIIWKAYTESLEYSRTGLGILLLRVSILSGNQIICKAEKKIDVDCCKKASASRVVEIWWEDFGTCSPYINYDDVTLCKMPTTINLVGSNSLSAYTTPSYAAKPLYAVPKYNGGCLPFEWIITGPIAVVSTSEYKDILYFHVIGGICKDYAHITLKDRCGNSYEVVGTPCCYSDPPPATLTIHYTSLSMSCNQQQDLHATGGCGPYSWSLSGGGSLSKTQTDFAEVTTYTAPSSNNGCSSNPTIDITDCCGTSTQIKLAVNCYFDAGTAYDKGTMTACLCRHYSNCDSCGTCYHGCCYWETWRWDCTGTQTYYNITRPDKCGGTYPSGCGTYSPPYCGSYTDCLPECCQGGTCGTGCVGTCDGGSTCGEHDCRSAYLISNGCCPLNPWTGLPW